MASSLPPLWRKIGLGVGGGAALSTAAGALWFNNTFGNDALPRLATAYYVAIPALASYKWTELVYERIPTWLNREIDEAGADAEYERLHAKHAPAMLDVIMRLRGFYIKTGWEGIEDAVHCTTTSQ